MDSNKKRSILGFTSKYMFRHFADNGIRRNNQRISSNQKRKEANM